MKLRYKIEDLEGYDFVVEFEFHKQGDGVWCFDGAWDIIEIWTTDYEDQECITGEVTNADQIVHRWLSQGGEDLIDIRAQKELR